MAFDGAIDKAHPQYLVDQSGFTGACQSAKRYVRKLRRTLAGAVRDHHHAVGQMVRDQRTGKYLRTRLFVMTLSYTRKSVRLLRVRAHYASAGGNCTRKPSRASAAACASS